MALVSSVIDIQKPAAEVFALASRVEEFPEFMPDVISVDVESREADGSTITRWKARVKVQSINKIVEWSEREMWDAEALSCKYEQVEGDFKVYYGDWSFVTLDSGATQVTLNVEFDLGIPLVGPLIAKLLNRIMQNNCDGMLKAIKEKAEDG